MFVFLIFNGTHIQFCRVARSWRDLEIYLNSAWRIVQPSLLRVSIIDENYVLCIEIIYCVKFSACLRRSILKQYHKISQLNILQKFVKKIFVYMYCRFLIKYEELISA